jgi:hypothetical protein
MDEAKTQAALMPFTDRPDFWHDLTRKMREEEEKAERAISCEE